MYFLQKVLQRAKSKAHMNGERGMAEYGRKEQVNGR